MTPPSTTPRAATLLLGLFCTTSSTLAIELLDTRLMSVVTWYHLSFFALSLAMLGMAAGAVHVFQAGEAYEGPNAPRALARWGLAYAASALGTHLLALCMPVLQAAGPANQTLSFLALTVTLALPFVLSGVVVSIVLTRIPGPAGAVYAVDLVGAAAGCLATLGLLAWADLTTAMEVVSAVAAVGALSFAAFAGVGWTDAVAVLVACAVLAAAQSSGVARLHVTSTKGRFLATEDVESEYWSLNGQVVAFKSQSGPPFYWSKGKGAPDRTMDRMETVIDGFAATYLSRWDGQPESLDWVSYDLTALPYHVVKGGDVAVIGVGGGRDVLSALWGNSRSVTGIELNRAFLQLHERLSDYSGIVRDPRVTLVHDEARSWLTRTDRRFDVIQMSLIDTWAATGAGAFTLSENALYTREGFVALLDRLKPGGVLSVSRWYAPGALSETSRLVSLATSALIRSGAENPRDHLVMATNGPLATLLVARSAFTDDQLAAVHAAVDRYGFGLALAPGVAENDLVDAIASAHTDADIAVAIAPIPLDLTPPTDNRPYFFNLLLPGQRPTGEVAKDGVISGNLVATRVLTLAVGSSLVALVALVAVPLLRHHRPGMPPDRFAAAIAYFAGIGLGFMLAQVAFLQRLGPYLGAPIYAVSLVLFSMILASGVGAALSDRVDPVRTPLARTGFAAASSAALVGVGLVLPWVLTHTVTAGLAARGAVAVGVVAVPSVLLGFHFPLGMRAVRGLAPEAGPWMWGINGGAGVVASGAAVVVSMWFGIEATQLVAAACYAGVAVASARLWRPTDVVAA